MDRVLTADRPRLLSSDAVAVATDLFGVPAHGARDLGSERDRAFALEDADGTMLAVLKVSNASEDPAVLDMEAGAALYVAASSRPVLHVVLGEGTAQERSDPVQLVAHVGGHDGEELRAGSPRHG